MSHPQNGSCNCERHKDASVLHSHGCSRNAGLSDAQILGLSDDHFEELVQVMTNTREFCGDEVIAARDWAADNGIKLRFGAIRYLKEVIRSRTGMRDAEEITQVFNHSV